MTDVTGTRAAEIVLGLIVAWCAALVALFCATAILFLPFYALFELMGKAL